MKSMKADRDASMDQLLASTLKSRATAAKDDACLDVETLAAWADGALDARERAAAEQHAADCARCQELLATMVRTLPPEVAKSPWRMPSLTWLAPLTAAATALAIWVAVPKPAPVQVSDGAAAVVDQSTPVVPSVERQSASPAKPVASQRAKTARPGNAEDQLAKELELPRSAAELQPNVLERRENDSRDKQEAPAASGEQKAIKKPDASNVARAAAAPARAAAGSVAASAAAAPAAPPAQLQESVRLDAFAAQSRVLTAIPEVIVVSSNPSTRFRLLPDGAVQRSADAGSTWRTEATGATERLTAGSSPSPSICWLVGSAGTVLLSTDGRSWRRVAFPEVVDLRSVTATDRETATVTTADGRAFVTTDGGQTWSRTPGG
jgi:hypothetical protein